jgi:hypothetical protein
LALAGGSGDSFRFHGDVSLRRNAFPAAFYGRGKHWGIRESGLDDWLRIRYLPV